MFLFLTILSLSDIQLNKAFSEAWELLLDHIRVFIQDLPKYVFSILIIILGILLSRYVANVFRRTIGKKSKDPLMTNFLAKAVKFGFILLVFMLSLRIAGLGDIAAGLFTAAGASAIVIGFAF